jgi:hypothetical protein
VSAAFSIAVGEPGVRPRRCLLARLLQGRGRGHALYRRGHDHEPEADPRPGWHRPAFPVAAFRCYRTVAAPSVTVAPIQHHPDGEHVGEVGAEVPKEVRMVAVYNERVNHGSDSRGCPRCRSIGATRLRALPSSHSPPGRPFTATRPPSDELLAQEPVNSGGPRPQIQTPPTRRRADCAVRVPAARSGCPERECAARQFGGPISQSYQSPRHIGL